MTSEIASCLRLVTSKVDVGHVTITSFKCAVEIASQGRHHAEHGTLAIKSYDVPIDVEYAELPVHVDIKNLADNVNNWKIDMAVRIFPDGKVYNSITHLLPHINCLQVIATNDNYRYNTGVLSLPPGVAVDLYIIGTTTLDNITVLLHNLRRIYIYVNPVSCWYNPVARFFNSLSRMEVKPSLEFVHLQGAETASRSYYDGLFPWMMRSMSVSGCHTVRVDVGRETSPGSVFAIRELTFPPDAADVVEIVVKAPDTNSRPNYNAYLMVQLRQEEESTTDLQSLLCARICAAHVADSAKVTFLVDRGVKTRVYANDFGDAPGILYEVDPLLARKWAPLMQGRK
jgi:hypothetical protein